MGKRVSDIESLYPPFAEQIQDFNRKIEESELHAYLFESYRSFERQEELYSQGRKKENGIWVVVDKTQIVTKATPGKSWHAYGIAADFVFDSNPQKQGIQWTWEDADVTKPGNQPLPWARLGELGVSCGLEWAGNWTKFREFPHFQNRFEFDIKDLYNILIKDGINAVWKELDKKVKPEKTTIIVPEVVVTPVEEPVEEIEVPVINDDKKEDVKPIQESGSLFKLGLDIIMGILRAFGSRKQSKK